MDQKSTERYSLIDRRTFLKAGVFSLAALSLPTHALAYLDKITSPEKSISLHNIHTGESLKKAIFWAEGEYVQQTLEDVNFLLRDYRNDKIKTIDPQLLDILYTLHQKVGGFRPFQVISGYRSPETNAFLARTTNGVAQKSLHIQGKAIDIRLPGYDLADLRKAAMTLKSGGVGYYPKSEFIHLDTGKIRYW